MKLILTFFVVICTSLSAFSQQITGTVKDENGLPMPGVNVVANKSNHATQTDFDGNFSIEATVGDPITFSMIGYQTLTANALVNLNVIIKEDNKQLEEVVVIGYGTKKAGSITGSVAQIKSAEILKTPAQSAIQSIQGKAAGVNIVTNDEPGANPSIRIRGLGTVLGGRDPLYIIDGLEASSLNGLSPNEIETIDILKDASSLAIYGQKGSNGVVVITTKKGKPGKLSINYDTYYGKKMIQKKVKLSQSDRFAYYNNAAQGSSTYFNNNQPYNTNWLDEITSDGEVASHHIGLSGGSENVNFYFGITNLKEEGILNGTQFERTNINSRNQYTLLDSKLKINQSINISIVNNTPKPLSAFTNAYKQSPIVPVKFDNGRWGVPLRNVNNGLQDIYGTDRFNNVGNPVAQLHYTNERNRNLVLFGSVGAEYAITKNLKINSNFGATYDVSKGFTYTPSRDIWMSQNPTSNLQEYAANSPINTLQQRKGNSYNWNWDNYITYKNTIYQHDFSVTVGMNRSTTNISDHLSATRWNVPEQSNYWSLNLSDYNTEVAPGSIISHSNSTPTVSLAYFARLDYEFNDKYLLSASFRREGNSIFTQQKRWGNFPGISAGWIISNENFMADNTFIDFLKIRGGYGEVGNGNSLYALNIPVFASNYNYAFGPDQTISPGSNQPYQVDPNLTWETMKEFDLGIDFTMIKGQLSGSIDFYDRKSENVILPVTLPTVLSPGNVTLNTGNVSNKGIEGSLKWTKQINQNWKYAVGGNISYNKNELQKVNNAYFSNLIGGSTNNGEWTKQVMVGESLGSFYVYDVTGFDDDGDFTYSPERVVAGSYLPTYTYGFNLAVSYKNLDLSVDAYGVAGNKLYNGKKAQRFGGENIEFDVLNDFWIPSNQNATNPRPFNAVPKASTYYIESGDYLRINNITLGYTLPTIFDKINKVRVYATAINPFMFTKFSGYSPEIAGNNNADPLGSAGIELDAYPTNKTFLIGLNVSF